MPKTEDDLVDRLEQPANHLLSLEWKVYDIVVVPVREIDVPSPGARAGRRDGARGSGGDRGGAERAPAGSR